MNPTKPARSTRKDLGAVGEGNSYVEIADSLGSKKPTAVRHGNEFFLG